MTPRDPKIEAKLRKQKHPLKIQLAGFAAFALRASVLAWALWINESKEARAEVDTPAMVTEEGEVAPAAD